MLEAGKQYTDRAGTKLGQMNPATVPGQFWCARRGDGRYYSEDGTCLRLLGEENEGKDPAPEHNIVLEAG